MGKHGAQALPGTQLASTGIINSTIITAALRGFREEKKKSIALI